MKQSKTLTLSIFGFLTMCDIFCYKLYTTLKARRLYIKQQLLLLSEHILQSDECDIPQGNNFHHRQLAISLSLCHLRVYKTFLFLKIHYSKKHRKIKEFVGKMKILMLYQIANRFRHNYLRNIQT